MIRRGKTIIEIQVDEEGAIARNSTFTLIIVDEFPGIIIVPTGGYASWLNGRIEHPPTQDIEKLSKSNTHGC
eukprot:5888012-Ditylum_brightwellii.AAC.1